MLSKQFLYEEYVLKNKTALEIGKSINLSDTQVRYWIKYHDIPIKNRGGRSYSVDLTGMTFGEYTVIEQVDGNGHCAIWKCRCSCGNINNVKSPCLRRGEIKSCGKCKEHYNWKGYEEISGNYFNSVKKGAEVRNIKFSLTIEDLWNLYIKQSRKCAISNIDIFFVRSHTSFHKTQTASLDRIDSNKDYTLDNIQWVHKMVNKLKREYDQEVFIYWCNKITSNSKLDNATFDKIEKSLLTT